MNNQELKHHGIPGMRWGVRKAKDQGDGSSNKPKTKKVDEEETKKVDTRSKDAIRYDDIKHKQLNELSNEELRWLSERIRLEQEYNSRMSSQKREKINQIKNDIGTAAQVASSVWTIVNVYDNLSNRSGRLTSNTTPKSSNTTPKSSNKVVYDFDKPKVKPMKKSKGKLTPKSTSLTVKK
jgi:hypothetical protein